MVDSLRLLCYSLAYKLFAQRAEMRRSDDRMKMNLAVTAMMAAVICVLAPFSIPIGPVPVSLTSLVIYFYIFVFGWRMTAVSYLVYVLIGAVGLPVFSGFAGGLGKLMGPTGGYIAGMLPMAIVAGMAAEKCRNRGVQLLFMILGTALCYTLGTAWFCRSMDVSVSAAMGLCVLPFIPGDLVKMLVALKFGSSVRRRIAVL